MSNRHKYWTLYLYCIYKERHLISLLLSIVKLMKTSKLTQTIWMICIFFLLWIYCSSWETSLQTYLSFNTNERLNYRDEQELIELMERCISGWSLPYTRLDSHCSQSLYEQFKIHLTFFPWRQHLMAVNQSFRLAYLIGGGQVQFKNWGAICLRICIRCACAFHWRNLGPRILRMNTDS